MFTKRDLLRSAALAAITASTAKSVPVLAQTSADRPGFLKAKDIAEAGFIYGLPIVMGYGVMYEFALDRNSGQFKAPFNQIANAANSYSPTKTPPLSRRTATRLIQSYGWTCGRSRSCFRFRQWTRSGTTRSCCVTAIPTTTAISGPVPREAKLGTTWLLLRTGRARLRPELKRCSGRAPCSR